MMLVFFGSEKFDIVASFSFTFNENYLIITNYRFSILFLTLKVDFSLTSKNFKK